MIGFYEIQLNFWYDVGENLLLKNFQIYRGTQLMAVMVAVLHINPPVWINSASEKEILLLIKYLSTKNWKLVDSKNVTFSNPPIFHFPLINY